MIQYIVSIVVILLTSAFFKLYYLPKKQYDWYATTLESLGYKVFKIPFQPLSVPWVDQVKNNAQKLGDGFFHQKNDYPGYDIVLSNIMTRPGLIFISPKVIKEFMSPDRLGNYTKIRLGMELIMNFAGKGIAFTENKDWKRKRKLMSKLFNFDFVKSQIPQMAKICDRVMDQTEEQYFLNHLEEREKGCIFTDIFKINAKIFSKIMLASFFGNENIDEKIDGIPISQFTVEFANSTATLSLDKLILLFGYKWYKMGLKASYRDLERRRKKLMSVSKAYIQKVTQDFYRKNDQQKSQYKSIIEAMIFEKEMQKKKKFSSQSQNSSTKEEEIGYDDEEMFEEFITFLVAGTDTTASYLLMMLYYIFEHPQVEKKLRQSIDKVIKNNEDFTFQKLKELEYIDWIQLETTRMYGPSVHIFYRQSNVDHFIKDIPIKKGVALTYVNLPVHYNQEFYKNPHEFRPERWESECKGNDPFCLIGFSFGPRSCLGKQLALLESKVALIKYMKRYSGLKEKEKRVLTFIFMATSLSTEAYLTKI